MKHHLGLIHKLSSRRGMSITFGLLLMLVAMTIGAVVLTAGTAAAGRNIRNAEADGRYYAVASAAEFVRDMFDGKTSSYVRMKKETATTVITRGNKKGEVLGTETKPVTVTYDADFTGIGEGLMGTFGYALLVGNQGVPARDADHSEEFIQALYEDTTNRAAAGKFVQIGEDGAVAESARTFTVAFASNDRTDAPLTVTVTGVYTLDADGTITMLLTAESADGKKYTAELTFTAQFTEEYSADGGNRTSVPTSSTMETDPDNAAQRIETQTDVTVTERISSVTWKYAGTRTIRE